MLFLSELSCWGPYNLSDFGLRTLLLMESKAPICEKAAAASQAICVEACSASLNSICWQWGKRATDLVVVVYGVNRLVAVVTVYVWAEAE